ncbi:hypothetical protein EBN03_22595 [Nocardia stercoris]|uniref:Uncharacterized protein n=1 Tax=Nocardia stercoris TaxID=2483361 RepID=A0A3M2KZF8_9NOCA|nr:hypothetical protein EBN03_22595 [Nocardia stercoris]
MAGGASPNYAARQANRQVSEPRFTMADALNPATLARSLDPEADGRRPVRVGETVMSTITGPRRSSAGR